MAYRFEGPTRDTSKNPEVLILGGVHGDESEGFVAANALLKVFLKEFSFKLNITLIPVFNPEGAFKLQRTNSAGVDLNRNLPTKDWSPDIKGPRYHPGLSANSEPENQALVKFIEMTKPVFVLSLHSWHPVLNVNGDCLAAAEAIQAKTNYKIDTDIGYPTPGCLGTYAGLERKSATLTYEIERGLEHAEIIKIHIPAILAGLKATELSQQTNTKKVKTKDKIANAKEKVKSKLKGRFKFKKADKKK